MRALLMPSLSLCHVSHYKASLRHADTHYFFALFEAHPYNECHTIGVLIQFHSRHPKH